MVMTDALATSKIKVEGAEEETPPDFIRKSVTDICNYQFYITSELRRRGRQNRG